jgi:hypothetical protein
MISGTLPSGTLHRPGLTRTHTSFYPTMSLASLGMLAQRRDSNGELQASR